MNAEPNRAAAAPRSLEGADAPLFAALDGYWEALQRGDAADPEPWTRAHPEGSEGLEDLRLVSDLHDALQLVREDSGAAPMPASAGDAEREPRPFLPPGTRLDQLEIECLLGHGGMGEVYLARHALMGKHFAVKVLPARLTGENQALSRFLEEVRVQAQLPAHPNLVAAHYAGEHQGRHFLTMEYVPGVNLRRHVEQTGPLPVAQACAVIRQVALGLEHIHRYHIVHRDLKPSNLVLTPEGTVKILDLGLARLTQREVREGETTLTPSGAVLGTLDYLAPEQAGDPHAVDARSDLYSLGCTFFYLLTGKPPFASHAHLEKVVAHATKDPPTLQTLRPEIPAGVAGIVNRLLAKKPADRYPSARALIEALDAATGSASQAQRPAGSPLRRRLRALFLMLPLAILAVSLPGVWSLRPGKESIGNPSPVIRNLQVTALEINALRPARDRKSTTELGKLGKECFATRFDDQVRVVATLSEPAYCYLIAFNPNGKDQLCYPEDDTPSVKAEEMRFPIDAAQAFTLNDATEGGLQAFVLVASRQALRPYAEWKASAGAIPWRQTDADGVWGFDGRQFKPLGTDRGEVQDLAGLPKPFVDVCRFLKAYPRVEALHALAFPVKPKA